LKHEPSSAGAPGFYAVAFWIEYVKPITPHNLVADIRRRHTDDELAEWLPAIETMATKAESGILFFNNHVRAQVPRNAEQLAAQLGFLM
jgi:uncharacterized protein YecE (DUF72 family)